MARMRPTSSVRSARGIPAGLVACGLLAAACGDGGSSSADAPAASVDEGDDAAAPEGSGSDGATASTASTTAAPATTTTTTTTTTTEVPIPEVVITVVGEEELILDQSESNCNGSARPDLPTRALRSGDQVSLILSHTSNHRLVGPDFDSLALSCDPIFTSAFDHDPAGHAHHEWVGAVYTDDGVTVHGVIHNEYHGYNAELADSRRALLDREDPGDWEYFARSGGSFTPMSSFGDGPIDAHGAGGLCTVEFWGAHPDVGCDAVSRWTSDRDGQLVIDIDAARAGEGGNGVTVDVRVDGVEAWRADLSDAERAAATRLTVDVVTGSTVDVGVSANGDSSFDAVELRTVITADGERCTGDIWSCTYVELTAVRSDDGGATYVPTSPGRDLVAAPPGTYEHDAGFAAMWQPSNIVAHPDGSHVMVVQYDDARNDSNSQYSCLLRTEDLSDPSAWRAWDGEAFSIEPFDQYASDAVVPTCARVAPAPISGLVWHEELELFVAVGGFGQFGRNGQYALVSPDLVTWSRPIFIQAAEFVFTRDTPPFEPYATLIDHASAAPSFDTIGDTPHLYFTRINDMSTLDFDLVRVPLEISLAG